MWREKSIAKTEVTQFNDSKHPIKLDDMMNAFHFRPNTQKLSFTLTGGIMMGLLCSMMVLGQEQANPEPKLSKATLEVLEAQAQQKILESPKTKTPDEASLSTEKKKKIETGGLLKEWFAPFEKKSTNRAQSGGKSKRKTFWSWFDPTAPVYESETQTVPVDWRGRRKTPQSFGNRKRQEPEGLTLFFLNH